MEDGGVGIPPPPPLDWATSKKLRLDMVKKDRKIITMSNESKLLNKQIN